MTPHARRCRLRPDIPRLVFPLQYFAPEGLTVVTLIAATAGLFVAGLCKGVLGVGLPLIGVPVLVTFMPARDVVAIIWLSLVVANAWQAFQGGGAGTIVARFWPMLLMMVIGGWLGTMLLVSLDEHLLLATVGAIVVTFSSLNLARPHFELPPRLERPVGIAIGLVAGILLGVALHLGPLIILLFVAIRLPKETFIRATGVTFLLGVLMIGIFYAAYGVFQPRHIVPMIAATVPVAFGTWIGQKLRVHIDEQRFRKWLFVLLIVIGANLIRKGLF